MEYGQASQGSRSDQSGRATLNEVLYTELGQLRPSLLAGIEPAMFPDSDQQRVDNLRDIYGKIATLGTDAGARASEPLSALCLSGGGIRSATFNLGVLQGLAKIGLLGKFDYLSSVSGGGYIAAWLRTWMHRETVPAVVQALANLTAPRDPLAPEPAPVENLREYSNYLTPRLGLFSGDTWAAAGIIARNLILNWLVLVPLLGAVVGIPLLFLLVVRGTGIPEIWYRHLLCAAVGIELLASLSVYAFRRFAKRPGTPQAYFIVGCVVPICLAGVLLCTAASGLSLPWHDSAPHPCCSDITALWQFSAVWFVAVPLIGWFVAEVLAFLFPSWTQSAPAAAAGGDRSAMRKQARQAAWVCEFFALLISGLVATALLALAVSYGFSILFAHPALYVMLALPLLLGIYLIARVLFVGIASLADTSRPSRPRGSSDDADREWWARLSGWLMLIIMIWVAGTGLCLAGAYLSDLLHSKTVSSVVKLLVTAAGTASGLVAALTGHSENTPATKNSHTPPTPLGTKLLAELAGVIFIVCVIIMLSWGMKVLGEGIIGEPGLFTTPLPWAVWLQFLSLMLGLVLLALAASRVVNVNRFSMHGMYRNRLVRAYLGASNAQRDREVDPFTGFALNDNLTLQALGAEVRPLPIINTTLNLVQGENLAWQQRKAESFSMTPFFCGNWFEGYRRSTLYGGPGGITVGTAMTVSGAAANPNMGYNSSPVLAFIMGIFNLRLGAWLGNTNLHGSKSFTHTGPKLALMPLFAEMFGLTNSSRRYVNLSDGGHFDNLGLYEVVLRRCRHVLVSDAGSDESFAFEDLGNVIRKIRIDFGIPIVFRDKIEIRPNGSREPGLYCAIAEIRYSAVDGTVTDGQLIYIKPTLRGRIPPHGSDAVPYDVYSYSRSSEAFPHESTADQWFSESQFESYRALGSHILGQLGGSLTDAGFDEFLSTARSRIAGEQS
jgi:Patatin-like phospholipase